ncbi:MAG: ion transporter [Bacteroidetes bacterium]|nr:ion transporter [Bacteroidota bacterium]MBL6943002.1 ion transporter [Bacteroidales bacterium]
MKISRHKKIIHDIIFEADTRAGKLFDILLFITIIFSVIIVMLDSVDSLHIKYGDMFLSIEWIITFIFTIEYFLRIYSVRKSFKYIFSFYGIIDLLSILPTYISLFVTGTHFLLVIRMLRLLRIFRVFKLARYVKASNVLLLALRNSRRKIIVFVEVIMIIVVITGALMYLIEGPETGFTSIPKAIYWAIVTITTVGYGDIAPQTVLGQTIASLLMIIGFAIIAIPTSIIGSELINVKSRKNTHVCYSCQFAEHDDNAEFCKKCGEKL